MIYHGYITPVSYKIQYYLLYTIHISHLYHIKSNIIYDILYTYHTLAIYHNEITYYIPFYLLYDSNTKLLETSRDSFFKLHTMLYGIKNCYITQKSAWPPGSQPGSQHGSMAASQAGRQPGSQVHNIICYIANNI